MWLIECIADLAKILHDATETPAGAFKARGIPEALRMVEIMTIQTARSWGTCSVRFAPLIHRVPCLITVDDSSTSSGGSWASNVRSWSNL